jgi:hypothetical protein
VAASRWQGLGVEHHDYAVDAPSKESGGGTHRRGRASVGWRGAAGAAAFRWRAAPTGRRWPRGGPVARSEGEGLATGTVSEQDEKYGAGEKSGQRRAASPF